jgi:hypothetical protein
MASDPKGIYFGGGSSGLATILNSNQTAQTQQRLDAQARRKIADQVKIKEQKDKRADELKQADIWRMYQPALQQEFQSIVDDVKNDKIDLFEMRTRLADYAGKAKSSLDLKGEFDQTVQDYEKNKKVLTGPASEYYLEKFHANPTSDNLKKISTEPLNRYSFLEEEGGSKFVNKTEAFRDVVEKSLGDWVENTIKNDQAKGKVVARGLLQFAESTDFSKVKSFSDVDPKTGKIKVKNVDQLIESGVVDLFEQDAYTNRVLEDRTNEIIGDSEVTPEDRQRVKSQVLREILEPYGATGVVKSEDTKTFRNYSVKDSGGSGSGGGDDTEARRIYDVFKSRSVGTGADVGEEKIYTQAMVKKYNLPKELVGKKFIESTALSGYKDEQGRALGRIVYRKGEKRFGDVARVEIIGKDDEGNVKRTWQSLTLNQLESFLPAKVYNQVEGLARGEGRIDSNGNFVYMTDEEYNQQ